MEHFTTSLPSVASPANFELRLFSAGSANDEYNTHLWVKGASLFIPQINELLTHTDYIFTETQISDFHCDYADLGSILEKHGSDKSTRHNYHILYAFILRKIGVESTANIFEIGLGTNNPNLVSTMGPDGKPGASLYAFREYLPNANIYGGDIDKNILFNAHRIQTGFVDQLDISTFHAVAKQFGNKKYDLIIDDGLHSIGANFNTLLFALNNITENGWIVIEDIANIDNWRSIDFMLNTTNKYKTYIVKSAISFLYVVHLLPSRLPVVSP